MFGRIINTFNNWKNLNSVEETSRLIQRGIEIKELIENKQKTALENIGNNQIKQRLNQDRNTKVTLNELSPGS